MAGTSERLYLDLLRKLQQLGLEIESAEQITFADTSAGFGTGKVNHLYIAKDTPAAYIWKNNEFVIIAGGGDETPIITASGCLKYQSTYGSLTVSSSDLEKIAKNKVLIVQGLNYLPQWEEDNIDYTTCSAKIIIFKDSDNKYYAKLKIYNYLNYSITCSISGTVCASTFNSSTYLGGRTITQNSVYETGAVEIGSSKGSPSASGTLTVSYGTSSTLSVTVPQKGYNEDFYINAFAVSTSSQSSGTILYFKSILTTSKEDYIEFYYNENDAALSGRLVANDSADRTHIDMSKFTFELEKKQSTSGLGSRLSNLLLNADKTKPIELVDFRLLSSSNSSNNVCILNYNGDTTSGQTFTGAVSIDSAPYTLVIEAQTTSPYLTYYLDYNKNNVCDFGGYTITTTSKTTSSSNLYSRLKSFADLNFIYKTNSNIYLPFILYNFKIGSTSATRNNAIQLRIVSVSGTTYTFKGRDFVNEYTITINTSSVNNVTYYYAAIPTGATYSGGNGIDITGTVISAKTKSNGGIYVDTDGLYIPSDWVDYLKKQTFKTPTISYFGVYADSTLITSNLVYEAGVVKTISKIKHTETNITNIDGNMSLYINNSAYKTDITPVSSATDVTITSTSVGSSVETDTFKLQGSYTDTTSVSRTISVTRTFYFVNPYYYGCVAGTTTTSDITTALVKALGSGKKLKTSKGLSSAAFAMSGQKALYVYPSSQGAISTIKDQNGYNVTSTFDTGTFTFTTDNNGTATYRYYLLKDASGNTMTYTFS